MQTVSSRQSLPTSDGCVDGQKTRCQNSNPKLGVRSSQPSREECRRDGSILCSKRSLRLKHGVGWYPDGRTSLVVCCENNWDVLTRLLTEASAHLDFQFRHWLSGVTSGGARLVQCIQFLDAQAARNCMRSGANETATQAPTSIRLDTLWNGASTVTSLPLRVTL